MIIGGFYDIDTEKALKAPDNEEFLLRADIHGEYSQKYYTNNGRTATVLALENGFEHRNGDQILLPEYLCISVIDSVKAAGFECSYYKLNDDLTINTESLRKSISKKTKAIYVIHYFGFPQPAKTIEEIKKLSNENEIPIIEDLTQSLFTVSEGRIGFGDYIVASLRKWFPMTDGGLLCIKNGRKFGKVRLKNAYDEAVFRQLLISVVREKYRDRMNICGEEYIEYEKAANAARYIDFTPASMTELSYNIFFNSDYKELIRKRVENYHILYQKLENNPGLNIMYKNICADDSTVPFGFPVTVRNRNEFYGRLLKQGIVGEIQWVLPVGLYKPEKHLLQLSEHMLMLQCDQRYGPREMEITADAVLNSI